MTEHFHNDDGEDGGNESGHHAVDDGRDAGFLEGGQLFHAAT